MRSVPPPPRQFDVARFDAVLALLVVRGVGAFRARRPSLLAPAAARHLAERRQKAFIQSTQSDCGARRPGGPASAFAAAPAQPSCHLCAAR